MPLQLLVSGPLSIHVGLSTSSGTLACLGYSERGVRLTINSRFEDVLADISGPYTPFDVQFFLEDAVISADVSLLDPAVLADILNRGEPGGASLGSFSVGHVGGLVLQEGAALRLVLFAPYSVDKPTQSSNRSWNFPTAYLLGPDVFDPLGSKVTTVRTVFRAIPAIDTALGGSFGTLFNADVSGVQAPPNVLRPT